MAVRDVSSRAWRTQRTSRCNIKVFNLFRVAIESRTCVVSWRRGRDSLCRSLSCLFCLCYDLCDCVATCFATAHYALREDSRQVKIALVWHCKTPRGWRRFPVLIIEEYGRRTVRHGWVNDGGIEAYYPEGRFQLRSFINGKQHFQTAETRHPNLVAA